MNQAETINSLSKEFQQHFSICPFLKTTETLENNFKNVDEFLLKQQLKHYSKILASLYHNGCALDLSETGTGKTYVSVAVLKSMGFKSTEIMIVAPKSSLTNWMTICQKVSLFPPKIISHGILSRIKNKKNNSAELDKHFKGIKVVVIDEAHTLRNISSNIFKTLHRGRLMYQFRLLMLSATLMELPKNMLAIGRLLYNNKKDEYGRYPISHWYYCTNQGSGGGYKRGELTKSEYLRLPAEDRKHDINCMRGLTDPLSSSMKNKDFGLINGFAVQPRVYEWDAVAKKVEESFSHYQKDLKDLMCNIEKSSNEICTIFQPKIASAIEKQDFILEKQLKGQMNSALNIKRKESFSEEKRLEIAYQKSVEIVRIDKVVNEAVCLLDSEASVVIFVLFKDSLFHASKLLKAQGLNHSIIMGGQTIKERDKEIKNFQDDKNKIILSTIAAGSNSISLHADESWKRKRISILCPTYNATSFKQALGRTNRVGRTSEALVIVAFVKTKIEKKMAFITKQKIKNIDDFNGSEYSLKNLALV